MGGTVLGEDRSMTVSATLDAPPACAILIDGFGEDKAFFTFCYGDDMEWHARFGFVDFGDSRAVCARVYLQSIDHQTRGSRADTLSWRGIGNYHQSANRVGLNKTFAQG